MKQSGPTYRRDERRLLIGSQLQFIRSQTVHLIRCSQTSLNMSNGLNGIKLPIFKKKKTNVDSHTDEHAELLFPHKSNNAHFCCASLWTQTSRRVKRH